MGADENQKVNGQEPLSTELSGNGKPTEAKAVGIASSSDSGRELSIEDIRQKVGLANRNENRRRTPFDAVKDLILNQVKERGLRADPKLKAELAGTILISFVNSKERIIFEFGPGGLTVAPCTKETAAKDTADCVITISEQHLLEISTGDLNPQIAMLSHKIMVTGRASMAIYFFNLVSPHHYGADSRD